MIERQHVASDDGPGEGTDEDHRAEHRRDGDARAEDVEVADTCDHHGKVCVPMTGMTARLTAPIVAITAANTAPANAVTANRGDPPSPRRISRQTDPNHQNSAMTARPPVKDVLQ